MAKINCRNAVLPLDRIWQKYPYRIHILSEKAAMNRIKWFRFMTKKSSRNFRYEKNAMK